MSTLEESEPLEAIVMVVEQRKEGMRATWTMNADKIKTWYL
jgi:hypothetical protein